MVSAVYRQALATDRWSISYAPQLNSVTGSVLSTILLQRVMFYWSALGGPFCKFFAPCEHPSYRAGESWQEELGFTRSEFGTALANIGTRILADTDIERILKHDKTPKSLVLYRTSHDRRTFYFLNEPLCDGFMTEAFRTAEEQRTRTATMALARAFRDRPEQINPHVSVSRSALKQKSSDSSGLFAIPPAERGAKFQAWWDLYDHKVGRGECERLFAATINIENVNKLMLHTINYTLQTDPPPLHRSTGKTQRRDPEHFLRGAWWDSEWLAKPPQIREANDNGKRTGRDRAERDAERLDRIAEAHIRSMAENGPGADLGGADNEGRPELRPAHPGDARAAAKNAILGRRLPA